MPLAIPGGIFPVLQSTRPESIHSNATITASGSAASLYTDYGVKEVILFVNVVNAPTGTTPSITFHLQEVDPGDQTTVFGTVRSSSAFTAAGTGYVRLVGVIGGIVKVTWTVTGTTPSFTGVYTTLVARAGGPHVERDTAVGTGEGLTLIGALDGSTARALEVDAGNNLRVKLRNPGDTADIGDTSNPVRTDPTGSTVQPVSDNGGFLSVDDGSGSLTVDTLQLPASLVSGRLDVSVGASLPGGTNNIGDVDIASALPAGTNRLGSVRLVDTNDVALDLARDTTIPAGSRGLLIVGEDDTGKSQAIDVRTDLVDGKRRLVVETAWSAGPQTDAFARLRTSSVQSIFDSKQIYGDQGLFYTSSIVGGGSITYNSTKKVSDLATTTASGDIAIRQTKRYFNYQPGKSLLSFTTFNFNGGQANVTKRVGYYDSDNGIFLELQDTVLNFVKRSKVTGSVVETRVAQGSWNVDTMNGSGSSGIILDTTKAQILVIDFEWLGVGLVRMGFMNGSSIVYTHIFDHANITVDVYTQTPNLPIRWEIANTGAATGTPKITAICTSVMTEGGADELGVTRSASTGVTTVNIPNNSDEYPIISIRLQSTANRATIRPNKASMINTTGTNFLWAIYLNPTITGGAAPSWTSAGTSSLVEYDITRDGTVSGGILLDSGYSSSNLDSANVSIDSALTLAADYAGTSDELVLVARIIAGANEKFLGSFSWIEVL